MEFDFTALLVSLTFASGVIWAVDAWFLIPRCTKKEGRVKESEKTDRSLIAEYARSLFPIFLIVLVLRSFLFEPFRIPSASMMPTLMIGDFILVNKYTYGIRLPVLNTKIVAVRGPERGDIVVFRSPTNPNIPFIKRVVGLPGDKIVLHDKSLYINGAPAIQIPKGKYIEDGSGMMMNGATISTEVLKDIEHDILTVPGRPAQQFEALVPEGHYFVLGDNRDNSRDSRFWGFVPDENLIGKAFIIWMNWDSKKDDIEFNRIGLDII